jgi:Carboxylesterase family
VRFYPSARRIAETILVRQIVQSLLQRRIEIEIDRFQTVHQLLGTTCADDRRSHRGIGQHPSYRQSGERLPGLRIGAQHLDRCDLAFTRYAYDFAYRDAPFNFPNMPWYKPRAAHTSDIQFLFEGYHGGNLGVNLDQTTGVLDQTTGVSRGLDPAEIKLSDQLIAAWTRFADTGNPNGSGNSPWPRFTADSSGQYLVEDIPSLSTLSVAQFRADYKCDFFDRQLKY